MAGHQDGEYFPHWYGAASPNPLRPTEEKYSPPAVIS